jgi:Histidine kinase-, DNA gyrase B-, and HSP90-like ATPase
MKPLSANVTNTGTLGGPSKTMTIRRDAMAHIMSVLTNLYSDAKLAVLREYATNALDAHREAGVSKPISVVLPSDVKPTLVVEDFGVGMTTDEILNLYSSYGASTKRGTNEQTGMLGLGSKSALAYSSQFTVRTRKGGVETSALIYLNDRGEGEIKIVDTRATDATGTRIEIPVGPKDIREFSTAANNLFVFWNPADVSVKGHSIVHGVEHGGWLWITDKIALAPSGFLATERQRYYRYDPNAVYVVQGGVPYKVDKDRLSDEGKSLYNSLPLDGYEVVFTAPIGSVQFVPSREALYYTNDTNATIVSLFEDYRREVARYVTEKIDSAKDRTQALRLFEQFTSITPEDVTVTYKGDLIPSSIPIKALATDTARRSSGSTITKLPGLARVESYDAVIYGATAAQATDKGSYTVRVNAAGYLTGTYSLVDRWYGRGNSKAILIVVGDLPDGFDWYGVKATHIDTLRPKVARGGKGSQAKTEYQDREWTVVGKTYGTTTKIDPDDDKVVYVDAEGRYKISRGVPADWTVVMVPGNQHGRFAREFPKAMTRQEAVAKAAKDAKVTYTEADATYAANRLFSGSLSEKQIAEILDPDLRTVLQWQSKKPPMVVKMEKINSDLAWLNIRAAVVEAKTPTLDKMIARYEYLRYINGRNLINTLNAVYTYKYQGGTK